MDNLDKIIKQKAEHFEVPFNDGHWVEMEARLNKISSKRTKKLFFGSTASVITLVIASYFLFPTNPIKNLNSKEQILVKGLSNSSDPGIDQPTVSVIKKEAKNKVLRSEDISSETTTPNIISKSEKTLIAPSKNIVKTNELKTQIILAEEKRTIIPETIQKEEPSNLELNTTGSAVIKNSITITPTKKTVSIPKIKAARPSIVNASRNKSERYKIYKDENVSKKSVKRRRRSFFNFRKKRYKVPLSKKISSTSKKKK